MKKLVWRGTSSRALAQTTPSSPGKRARADKGASDELQFELVARDLKELELRAGWDRVISVCNIIAKHFLDGDLSRIGSKTVPVRRLAAHPLCPLSKTRLDELIAAYQVFRDEPAVQRSRLSPSHVAVVARCEADERRALLRRAEEEALGVRELKQRVRTARQRQGERRGRPPSLFAEKAQTRLENAELLVEEAVALLAKAESLGDLDERIRVSLLRLSTLVERGNAQLLSLGMRQPVAGGPALVRGRSTPASEVAPARESSLRIKAG